jgi:hypothetical protein
MVSSLAFIGINVVSLRLSRHQLAVVLRTMSDDLLRTHERLAAAQRYAHTLTTWIDMTSRTKMLAGARNRVVKRSTVATAQPTRKGDEAGSTTPLPGTCTPTGQSTTGTVAAQLSEAADWVDLSGLVGLCALQRPAGSSSSWVAEEQEGAWSAELEVLSRTAAASSSGDVDGSPGASDSVSERSSLLRAALHSLVRRRLLSPSLSGLGLSPAHMSALSLESVLAHPVCLSLFTEHASRTHNEDSLLCYAAIAQFRRTRTHDPLRLLLAAQIGVDFLAPGAECEINTSGPSKDRVRHAIRHARPLPTALFDDTQRELLTLIRTNLWASFAHTRAAKMCAVILHATEQTDKHRKTNKRTD